jgi:hypothetical protein
VSQTPRCVERLGIDENAKMTPAQKTTGSHSVSARDRVIAA